MRGIPEADAIGVVSRGYHIAWIPTRGSAAQKHLFPGVVEALARIRANHPDALVGSITNGLGSAAGAGLGAFFDFEISADAALDEEVGLHGDDARKPGTFPYEMALRKIAQIRGAETFQIAHPESWVHVGDDVVNDCAFAKTFGARAVRVSVPGVEPYVPGEAGARTRATRVVKKTGSTWKRSSTRPSSPSRSYRNSSSAGKTASRPM
jgi:putative hydrolase of the HAD superfamily